MNALQWWVVVWAVAALTVIYAAGWVHVGCPRWFLPCTCRSGLWWDKHENRGRWGGPQDLPGPQRADRTQAYASNPGLRVGELHDAWEQLDPDHAADQLIAEWHAPDLELTAEDWIARDLADLELLAWDARVQAARCWEIVHVEFPRLRAELCAA